jgi:gliding motility-associated-like protein
LTRSVLPYRERYREAGRIPGYRILITLCLTFALQFISYTSWAQALTPGTISLTGTNPVCKGNDPGVIVSTAEASPAGEITYQWQIEATPGNWIDLPVNGNSYDPGVLIATASYRRIAIYTLDNSLTAISNVITINVTDPTAPVANPTQAFCTITNPTVASLSATGSSIKWYTVNTGGTPLASNTPLTNGTYYVSQTVNGCEGPRTAVTATVNQTPVVTANPLAQTLCTGALTNIALTSNVTGTTFSWTVAQSNLSGATAGSGTSINQVLNTTGTVQGTATYTITPVANGCSGTPVQVVISVNTKPQVTAQVSPAAVMICTYETATFNVGVSGSPQPSIQWQESPDGSSWSNITGATSNSLSFTAYANQKGFRYRAILTNTCGTVISSEGLLDVSPPIGIKTQPTGTAVCNGNTATFFAEVNGQQTFTTTTWQISRDGGLTWINVDPSNVNTYSTGAENGVFQTTFAFNPTLADNGAKVRVVFTNNCPVYSNVVDLTVVALPPNPIVSNTDRCGPGSITLTAQPPAGATVDWYEVASGGSPVATGTNSFTTPNLSTTTTYYAVSRTLVSGCLSARVPVTITIKDIPTASVNNITICNGSATTLSVTTNASSPIYSWSPVASTASSITVSPNTSTSYTVTVTDGITACQIAATGTVYVNPTPAAPTAPSPVLYCLNSPAVALTASGAGGNQLRWYTTPTGGTPLPSAPVPSTGTTGNFSYWVSQVNNSNCEGPRTKVDVIVNPLPVVTVSPSVAICAGFSTTLTAAGAISYAWTPSTDLSSTTGSSVTADPSTTTTYTVTGTDVNGCKNTATATVTVNPLPTVSVNSPTICLGSSATLTATTNATSPQFSWTPGSATTPGITVTPSTSTNYTVTVTNGVTGCIRTATGTVTINPPATSNAGAPQTICSGEQISLSGFASGNANWTTSGTGSFSPTSSKLDAVYSPSAADISAGAVTLTLTAADPDGAGPCTTVDATVVMTINPLAIVSAGTSQTVCSGNSITLSGAISGGATSATWTAPSGSFSNPNALNTTYTPSITSGSVILTLTSNDPPGPCGPATSTVVINVNPKPAVNVSVSTLCSGSNATIKATPTTGSVNDYNYIWTVPSGFTNPGNVSTFSSSTIGTYTVIITNKTTNCPSSPVSGTLTSNPLLADPIVTNGSRCGAGTVVLSATADVDEVIDWYVNSTTTTKLSTGFTYTTGNLSAPSVTTYWVEARHSILGCKSARVPVTATVYAIPPAPTPVNASSCGPGSITLSATGCTGGTYNWYSASTGGTLLYTGNSYTTTVSATTSFWVSCTSADNCEGPRAEVVATVNPITPGTIGTNQFKCSGADPDLLTNLASGTGGSGSAITYQWESSVNGGAWTPIPGATGLTYDPPSGITVSTSYRRVITSVKNGAGGYNCSLPSNVVIVNVNPLPSILPSAIPNICFGTTSAVLSYTNAANGGDTYSITWNASAISAGFSNVVNSALTPGQIIIAVPVNTPAATYNGNLTISNSNTGCVSTVYPISITVNPLPVCSITGNNNICPGSTNNYSAPTGMSSYEWTITGDGTINGSTISNTVSVLSGSTCGSFTLTLTITNANGCTSTCSTTFTVFDNVKPTVTGTASIPSLGCNPPDPTTAFIDPSASDNCSAPVLKTGYPLTSTVSSTGCTNTQTRTWIFVDACGNESLPFVQTVTWTSDIVKPAVTGLTTIPDLGCNPVNPTASFVAPTATDNCGTPVLKFGYPITSTVAITGCNNSQTRTWIYVDACGNESDPFTQTITWKTDITKPVVTGLATIPDLGCNPPNHLAAFITPTATDNCGIPVLKSGYPVTSTISTTGCDNTQSRTWVFVDACGNESDPFVQTITWTTDNIKPVLTGNTTIPPLGCNPPNPSSSFVAPSVTDNCGSISLKTGYPITSSVSTVNCNNTQTRTWIYIDGCGNESDPFTQTISWTSDQVKPVLTGFTTIPNLGCNPPDPTAAFVAPAVSDNCGIPVLKPGYPQTSPVSTVNCVSTQTRTWIYVDACGNESEPFMQTVIWTSDQTKPVLTCPAPQIFCISSNNNYTIPAITATDNCSNVTVQYVITGATTRNGTGTDASGVFNVGVSNIEWTVTDGCNNIITCSTTVTVNAETLPLFNPIASICIGSAAPVLQGTSTNSISGSWSPAVINTSIPGSTTYTFTPTAGQCASSTTLSVTILAKDIPVFDPVGPVCKGTTAPLLPVVSNNGITGTWDKPVSTATAGKTTYTFTPTAGLCAATASLDITITDPVLPDFDDVGPYCKNAVAPALPTTSNNNITGTWDKSINTATAGKTTYTFTPISGQCAVSTTIEVEIADQVVPTFTQPGPYCIGSIANALPLTSNNGIKGSWSPSTVSTTVSGITAYTFTPDADQCGIPVTLSIEVIEKTVPVFDPVGPYCQGTTVFPLPLKSKNNITGTWDKALSTSVAGKTSYTFTPNAGQCATSTTIEVQIDAPITPVFDPIGPFCLDASVPSLPTSSKNGIMGTWDKMINTSAVGKSTYNFTPSAGQCANSTTIEIEITDKIIPVFDPVGPYCIGSTAPTLPASSNNGITGTWDKMVNTSVTGKTTYTFTPDADQCATPATMEVEVTGLITPVFDPIGPYCLNAVVAALPVISKNNISGTWDKTISTSVAGKTIYTFTSTAGQCATNTSIEVEIADQVTPTFVQFGPFCKGEIANALPQTSLNGIKGSWDKTISTSVTGVSTYTFTPDPGQCGIPATINIEVTDPATPTFDAVGPYCKGASAAVLPLKSKNNITGTWDKAINTSLIGKTIYTFTPDANQCALPTTLEVEVADQVVPIFDPTGPYCKDAPAAALPTTSKNNITGTWNKSVNTSVIGMATYTFTPDAGQCGSAVTIDIEVTDKITPLFDPVGPYCKGTSPAVLPSISKNNITGTWDKAINTSLSGKTIYTFTPDANQCALNTTLEVEVADQVIPVFDPIGPYCKDAIAAALPTTSKNNITGTWNKSVNTSIIGIATYIFTPDAGQCGSVTAIDIETTDKIAPVFDPVGPYCKGTSANALPLLSKNNITGTWDKPINTSMIGKMIYTFTPDANQCAVPAILEIEITDQIIPTFDPIAPYCKGATANALPTSSKNNITGTWDKLVNTGSIGIATYTFTPDAGQCAVPVSIDIETQNCCAVEVTVVATPITCIQLNGTITATASKGTPPYQYAIDNGAFQDNNTFTTKAGTFRIQVKDSKDCTAETTVTVDEIVSTLSATALAPDIPCDKTTGTISVQALNGITPYTFSLNGGVFQNADSFTDLLAGDYNITVKDGSGCTTTLTTKLNKVGSTPVLAITDPASVCAPGTIDMTDQKITNGTDAGVSYSYWQDASASTPVINPANISKSGIYYIKAENAAGCSSIKPVNISVADKPLLKITDPDASCTVADITAALVTMGSASDLTLSYWEDGLATTPLTGPSSINKAGTYFIKGTASGGCYAIEPVNVTILSLPSLNVNPPPAVCAPTTIDITTVATTVGSDPGLNFSYWEDANTTNSLSNPGSIKTSGTYYIKAVSKDGCVAVKPVDIVVNNIPVLTIKDPAAVCAPTAIDLTDPAITVGSETGLALSYWSDPNGTQQITSANNITLSGTYYIKATLQTGCFDIKPVKTDIRPLPVMTVTSPPAICAPASLDLTNPAIVNGSDNGLSFSYWTDPGCTNALSNPATVVQSGTYYIKGTAGTGCAIVKPVELTINPAPRLFVNNPPDVCTPNTVDITASSITAGSDASLAYSYWKDAATSQPIINPNIISTSGTYTLKAENAFGCITTQAVKVVINDLPTISMKAPDSLCIGLSTNINVVMSGQAPWSFQYTDGTQTYFVNNINSQPYQLKVTPTETTTYTIISVSDRYCTNRNPDNNKVRIHITRPIPGVRLKSVNTTAFTNTNLQARDIPSYTYDWQPNKGLNTYSSATPIFNYGKQTEYQIKMVSSAGCITIDSMTVRVVNQIDPDVNCDFYIPNVFSPNGDGRNDTYFPFTINIKEIRFFRIFNRWGELVFETKAFGEGWNGMYKGKLQPTDAYVWTAEAVCNDGTIIRKSGNVLLLK